ncbi:MAG TPA: Sua5/YciO/YrdC/YwlC family protein [Solirubrobacteraceae bacterium]|nr:Sua5/YciO/YrdC/YwlC family protein [Solirubrobacteraceae bacterium]
MSVHEPAVPDAEAFERCMAVGGVAVFPADTVYGLACDAQNRVAVERLYRLKRRQLDKPSAVMFFSLELAFAAVPEIGGRTRAALTRLMPGPVSVLIPNPGLRYPLACGADKLTLGLRVPDLPAFREVHWPILQSSANLAGGPDPCQLSDVPEALRRAADMVIDGGRLRGTPSTVIDLRRYEEEGSWRVVRRGGMSDGAVAAALTSPFNFEPAGYETGIRDEIPDYDELQDRLVGVTAGAAVSRILDLGTGTGETAHRLLAAHPQAWLTGVDTSPAMLAAARVRLGPGRVDLHVARLEDRLPEGPFELVASALAVHHLDADGKRDLFTRTAAVLAPGGRFVLADLIVPEDPALATIPLTEGYDLPSTVSEQLDWLREAGLEAQVHWVQGDLAVLSGTRPV